MADAGLCRGCQCAAKWIFDEEHSAAARSLRNPRNRLHAPVFLRLELTSVAWKKAQRGQLDAALAAGFPLHISDFEIVTHSDEPLLPAAMAIALEHRRSVYDSLYLVLALREECPLVTADRRFYDAVRDHFARSLLWVEEVEPA